MLGVSILPLSNILLLDIRNARTVLVFFVFHLTYIGLFKNMGFKLPQWCTYVLDCIYVLDRTYVLDRMCNQMFC